MLACLLVLSRKNSEESEYIQRKHMHMFNSCILHYDDTGIPQGSVLDPIFFSIFTRSFDSLIQMHGFSFSLPCRQKSELLFMPLTVFTSMISYPSDISTWMNNQHLKLNLSRLSCRRRLPTQFLSLSVEKTQLLPRGKKSPRSHPGWPAHIQWTHQSTHTVLQHYDEQLQKKCFFLGLNFLINLFFFLRLQRLRLSLLHSTLNHK